MESTHLAVGAIIIVALLAAGIVVYQNTGAATGGAAAGEAETTATTTTTTSTGEEATTTPPPDNTTTTTNTTGTGGEERVPLNITLEVEGGVVFLSDLVVKAEGGAPQVIVNLQLPNPCYTAKAAYDPEAGVIYVNLTSPAEGSMCIQMLKVETLDLTLDPPPQSGTVKLIIVKDGKVMGTYEVQLPLGS